MAQFLLKKPTTTKKVNKGKKIVKSLKPEMEKIDKKMNLLVQKKTELLQNFRLLGCLCNYNP